MARQSNQVKWIIALGAVVLFGVLIHSTLQATSAQYQVCMDFRGRSHCASATGTSSSVAIRSAEEIDCQMIANGRDETMVCLDTQPSSVREVKK
ncbi:MAG: hypothetical protein ABSA57_19900 [Candidatus Acidiferrales bacterium]|jgi:hypothetical protein